MNSQPQVACFLDVENIRYSLLEHGQELAPQRVSEKVLKYGLMSAGRPTLTFRNILIVCDVD